MKILHIINDEYSGLAKKIIHAQEREQEVKVIELYKKQIPYEDIIDAVFSSERVISW